MIVVIPPTGILLNPSGYNQGSEKFSGVCRQMATECRTKKNPELSRARQPPGIADDGAELTSACIDCRLANFPIYDLQNSDIWHHSSLQPLRHRGAEGQERKLHQAFITSYLHPQVGQKALPAPHSNVCTIIKH